MTGAFAGSQRRRQGGAIAIMAAILLPVAVLCLVLVIDSGRLYVQQRELQRIADVAALEAVSLGGMCAPVQDQSSDTAQAFAREAARRNGFEVGETRRLTARLGGVRVNADGLREFDPDSDLNEAVEVVVEHRVPTSIVANLAKLIPGSDVSDTINLRAEAVARRTAMGALWAGTGLLRVNSGASPLLRPLLNGLLGSDVNLDLVTYNGIVDSNVTLLELIEGFKAAGVDLVLGTVDKLLDSKVTLLELIDASIQALDRKKDRSQSVELDLALLRQLSDQLHLGVNVPVPDIRLGDLIEIEGPDGATREQALKVGVDLVSLVEAAIFAANKEHALTLTLGSGGLLENLEVEHESGSYRPASLELEVYVIEPPKVAIGYAGPLKPQKGDQAWRTEVKSAQVRVNLRTELNLVLINVNLGLAVTAGGGKAALESIDCATGREAVVSVLAKPALATVALGSFQSITNPNSPLLPATVTVLGTEHAGLITVGLSADAVAARGGDNIITTSDERLVFRGPFPGEPQTVSGSAGGMLAGLLDSLARNLKVSIDIRLDGGEAGSQCALWDLLCWVGKLVNEVVQGVVDVIRALLLGVLSPLLNLLGTLVLDPLLQLLGIRLDVVDVNVLGADTGMAELVR